MTYLIVSKERRDSPFFLSKDVIKFEGKWFFSEKAKEGRKEGKLKPRITIKDRSRREGKERTNETIEATSSLSKKKMQIKNSYSLNTEEIFERVSRVISHSVSFLEIPPRTARFRWHKCRAKCSFRLFVGQSASRTSTIERSVKRSARNNRVRRTRKFWPFASFSCFAARHYLAIELCQFRCHTYKSLSKIQEMILRKKVSYGG